MHEIDKDHNEFLIRVQASAKLEGLNPLPTIVGWLCTNSKIDQEIGVRYATYSRTTRLPINGHSPDIDALADRSDEVKGRLNAMVEGEVSYETTIHLVTPPIAAWNS